MIVWKVKMDRQTIVFETFKEAWNVYKEECQLEAICYGSVCIYPCFMRRSTYENLKEFTGW